MYGLFEIIFFLKRKSYLVSLLTLSFLFLQCQSGQESDSDSVTKIEPCEKWKVKKNKDGLWGYEDSKGKTMLPYAYITAEYFHNNVAIIQDTLGKYHLIDSTGNKITETGFTSIENFDGREVTVAFRSENQSNYFLRQSGEIIGGPLVGVYYVEDGDVYIGSEIDSNSIKTFSLFNSQGTRISEKFHHLSPVRRDSRKIFITEKIDGEEKMALMNYRGKVVSNWYDYVFHPNKDGFFTTMNKDGKNRANNNGLLNSEGKEILPNIYRKIDFHSEHELIECELMNYKTGGSTRTLFNYKIDDLGVSTKYKLRIYSKELIGISSSSQDYAFYKLQDGKFEKASETYQKILVSGKYEKRFLLFIPTGRYKDYTAFTYPDFVGRVAVVQQNKKFGLINEDLTMFWPIEYDSIHFELGKYTGFQDGEIAKEVVIEVTR